MNAPGCSTCGYAVEWLRSCYSSQWRLFRGGPASRGYYYFAPEGTPHYPSPHLRGSNVWTSDENDPPADLGEVEGTRRTYRKGILAVTYPPAVRVGSEECIRDGEAWPLPVIDRTLPGGIDSRCYPPDAPVPSRGVLLWLRGEELPQEGLEFANGQAWPAAPGTTIAAVAAAPRSLVFSLTDEGVMYASVNQRFFTEPHPARWERGYFTLGALPTVREYTAFMLARFNQSGPMLGLWQSNVWVMRVRPDRIEWQQGGQARQAMAARPGGWHIWSVLRGATYTTFRLDGRALATSTNDPPTALNAAGLDQDIGTTGAGEAHYSEVLIYPYVLNSDEDRSAWRYLADRAGVPLW